LYVIQSLNQIQPMEVWTASSIFFAESQDLVHEDEINAKATQVNRGTSLEARFSRVEDRWDASFFAHFGG
jgi:hypothetical protein